MAKRVSMSYEEVRAVVLKLLQNKEVKGLQESSRPYVGHISRMSVHYIESLFTGKLGEYDICVSLLSERAWMYGKLSTNLTSITPAGCVLNKVKHATVTVMKGKDGGCTQELVIQGPHGPIEFFMSVPNSCRFDVLEIRSDTIEKMMTQAVDGSIALLEAVDTMNTLVAPSLVTFVEEHCESNNR